MEKEITKEMLEKSIKEFHDSIIFDPTLNPICPNESFFQEKYEQAVAFIKKNGLPKHLEGELDLSSL
jgi:hypothetical protein